MKHMQYLKFSQWQWWKVRYPVTWHHTKWQTAKSGYPRTTWTPHMEAPGSYATSITSFQQTHHHIPENTSLWDRSFRHCNTPIWTNLYERGTHQP